MWANSSLYSKEMTTLPNLVDPNLLMDGTLTLHILPPSSLGHLVQTRSLGEQ